MLIGFSQVYTNKVVGKKNAALLDSLKVVEYPYALPIWGEKATKKGYQLPYSAGVSVNYFWQESDLTIKNLKLVSIMGLCIIWIKLYVLIVLVASAYAVNVRPDIWLFPFLNVYGIFGKAKTVHYY